MQYIQQTKTVTTQLKRWFFYQRTVTFSNIIVRTKESQLMFSYSVTHTEKAQLQIGAFRESVKGKENRFEKYFKCRIF